MGRSPFVTLSLSALLAAFTVATMPAPAEASAACCAASSETTAASRTASARASDRPATATVGQLAPAFTLRDVNGRRRSIDDFAGKVIVLEWINPFCPFVKRHYDAGRMQALQARYKEKGVAWLLIQSTRTDNAQYMAPGRLTAQLGTWRSRPTATLMDPDGTVGRKYGARTTPHMYVIDQAGTLVYAGAIDNDPRGSEERPTNLVAPVLDALLAGRTVEATATTPYGCSVKY